MSKSMGKICLAWVKKKTPKDVSSKLNVFLYETSYLYKISFL